LSGTNALAYLAFSSATRNKVSWHLGHQDVAVADDEVSAVVKLVVGVVEVRRRSKIVDRRHPQNSVFEDPKKFLKTPLPSVEPNLGPYSQNFIFFVTYELAQ
jgi:hypothetical protein